jgi:hypothetical protein
MKLKEIKNLDMRYNYIIENAYFSSISKENNKNFNDIENEKKNSLQKYIEFLIYSDIVNKKLVLNKLLKFDWNNSGKNLKIKKIKK